MKYLLRILITTVNVFVLASILPGIEIDNFYTAIVVAIVLSLLNSFIKPLLILFTLPATILTLGLFLFFINAFIIMVDAYFVKGFKIDSFWHAFLYSVILSFFNSFVQKRVFQNERNNRH